MADNNRDQENRNSDDREEVVVPIALPLSGTGSGYIPAVAPIKTEVDDKTVVEADAARFEPIPADYNEADAHIDREITDHFTQHSYIDTTEIAVTVKDGNVTLTGSVPDDDQRHYAEEVVQKVAGVKHVDNQLKVKKAQSTLVQNPTGKQ